MNGDITKYQILYRKKNTASWKSVTQSAPATSKTVSSLSSGITYQVKVLLFNNKYRVPSEIEEVLVGRKSKYTYFLDKKLII